MQMKDKLQPLTDFNSRLVATAGGIFNAVTNE